MGSPDAGLPCSGEGTREIVCKFSPAGTYSILLKYKYANVWYEATEEVQIENVSSPWYVAVDGNDNNDGQPAWSNAFRTIQTAIDTARDGDSIFIKAGEIVPNVYFENIDLKGKNVHIKSVDPAEVLTGWERARNTVIDGNQQGTTILFNGNETQICQLDNITIRGVLRQATVWPCIWP